MGNARENQTTSTVIVQEGRRDTGCCNCLWLVTTCEGILKLLQFFATLLSFLIICAGLDVSKYQLGAEYEFMVFVGVTACVFVIIHIILRVIHLYEKLPDIFVHPIVGMVLCSVAVLAFVVASSVVLDYSYGWDTLKAAAGCGFVSAVLFLIEIFVLFIRYKRGAPRQHEAEVAKLAPSDISKKAPAVQESKSAEELGFPP